MAANAWVTRAPVIHREIIGDDSRIRQSVLSLVSNAGNFTEAGSERVDARAVGKTHDTVDLEIRVTDTGVGIPASKLHRLIQPFRQVDASTTRKCGGTGLGAETASHGREAIARVRTTNLIAPGGILLPKDS